MPITNLIDSSNSDLTHAKIHENLGQQQGLTTSADYLGLFCGFTMIKDIDELNYTERSDWIDKLKEAEDE